MMRFIILFLVATGLSACASLPYATAPMADSEVMKVNEDVTPKEEKSRLIDLLSKIKIKHYDEAVHEIEADQ